MKRGLTLAWRCHFLSHAVRPTPAGRRALRNPTTTIASYIRSVEVTLVDPETILGRDEELASVDGFIRDDQAGSRALLIEGDAGIGKTTLWRRAVRLAERNGCVITSRASEVEAKLTFTVLGDLLGPVLDRTIDDLPLGQRRALEAALWLSDTAAGRPDIRAVSLATLGVFRALTAEGPLTIAIDDVQWVDGPSSRALSFALRRLEDESIVVVAARRRVPGLQDPLSLASLEARLFRLDLGAMEPGPLGRLLRQRLDRDFPLPAVAQIHRASRGNPFYAIEIGRSLPADGPSLSPSEPLPIPSDLEDLLRARVSALSRPAQDALLLAAAAAEPTQDLLETAGAHPSFLAEAEATGVVKVHAAAIEFAHPLLASAVYGGASTAERRSAHRRLATIVSGTEEAARHLALSAEGPDERIAAQLGGAGSQAETHGSPQAAAELFLLAAQLTPSDETESWRIRMQNAAWNMFDAGEAAQARRLVERILEDVSPGPPRADTLLTLAGMSWSDVKVVTGLLERALEEVGDDRRTGGRILADYAWAALQACDTDSASDRARRAIELSSSFVDAQALRLPLTALAMVDGVLGHPAADLLDRAEALQDSLIHAESSSPAMCRGRLQMWSGALDSARSTLERELARFRNNGHEVGCWEILSDLAEVELRAGRWAIAARRADEAYEIAVEADRPEVLGQILPTKAAVAATTGDVPRARAAGVEGVEICERTGDRWHEIRARSALGFLELSLGDHAAAGAWLQSVAQITETMGIREPGVFPFIPDAVETLVALGDVEPAEALTARLADHASAIDRPVATATLAHCRALVSAAHSDLEEASAFTDQALREHERASQPFELARTLLVSGVIHRRAKRKKPARDAIEGALRTFESLGAPLWAERARLELARIGGRPPQPKDLTPTEEEVARLVAEGRTNREVASALFMSPHTVDANLRRIYRKLGVRSRTELAARL
jgi:DNA-binding CsgD family transcriptional regulator